MAELLDDRLPTQNIEAEQAVSINWTKLTFIQLYEHLTLQLITIIIWFAHMIIENHFHLKFSSNTLIQPIFTSLLLSPYEDHFEEGNFYIC